MTKARSSASGRLAASMGRRTRTARSSAEPAERYRLLHRLAFSAGAAHLQRHRLRARSEVVAGEKREAAVGAGLGDEALGTAAAFRPDEHARAGHGIAVAVLHAQRHAVGEVQVGKGLALAHPALVGVVLRRVLVQRAADVAEVGVPVQPVVHVARREQPGLPVVRRPAARVIRRRRVEKDVAFGGLAARAGCGRGLRRRLRTRAWAWILRFRRSPLPARRWRFSR